MSDVEITSEQLEKLVDRVYQVSSFLVGNGDVCEIAAKKLRELALEMDALQTAQEQVSE